VALDVHTNEAAGDILVFLTGKLSRDVHCCSNILGLFFKKAVFSNFQFIKES